MNTSRIKHARNGGFMAVIILVVLFAITFAYFKIDFRSELSKRGVSQFMTKETVYGQQVWGTYFVPYVDAIKNFLKKHEPDATSTKIIK